MKVAVNLRLYVKDKIGGLENYVRNIVSGLDTIQYNSGTPLTIFAHQREVLHVSSVAPHAEVIPVLHETSDATIGQELASGRYDVLFCPLLVLDPLQTTVPAAVMMPDLQHEFFPEFFDPNTLGWRRNTYRPTSVRAKIIYTLSEHAKRTIVNTFKIHPDKVEVVYLDVDSEFKNCVRRPPSDSLLALRLPARYLLYPANFWPHKNHTNLLKAFALLKQKLPDLGLVLTGAEEGRAEVMSQARSLGIQNVFFPGYVNRSLLVELYQRAAAIPFVSRFEGFGIPILEAFHAETPVIASQAGSCGEIAGDAAVLVNEMDPPSIARGVEQVVSDRALQTQLVEAGKKRREEFSWGHALDQTLRSLERVSDPHYSVRRVEVEEYPVVSIVTPSYNMGRFIKQTVDSVLTQDYPHIDYIVMDGGSTDDTLAILQSYNGLLRYESKPDNGQADAVNKGFTLSHGKIFTFLNADDTYLPGAVGRAVTHMTRNPSAGVVYGEANYVQEDGTHIGRYPTLPFDPDYLSRCCYICQPASFIWREVFQSAGCMNPSLQFALDYDLWIRIARLYPMLKVDDVLATSRMYRENKTLGKRRPVYMEIMNTVKSHYGYVSFEWVFGYSSYLLDRKDQFFEISHPSLSKIGLSFVLGSYYNRAQMLRYWREWGMHLGIGARFNGKYGDGWISRSYSTSVQIEPHAELLTIQGRHLAPFLNGFELVLALNGKVLKHFKIKDHGPFELCIQLPPGLRGHAATLSLQANRSFRPAVNGDYRRLSCLIDSIILEPGERAS